MSPDGVARGWLRDRGAAVPCHVQIIQSGQTGQSGQIMQAGHLLGEAIAGDFRADLLRAGHGHGHYGFSARLREALPPGRSSVDVHLPRTGITAAMALSVPHLRTPRPCTVESLLAVAREWTTADLLGRPGCLDMDANRATMGDSRFIDGLFRFVLARWPSSAESRLHIASLRAGRVKPQDLLIELLASRERADMAQALPSPYDPEFPFSIEGVP